MLKKSKKSEGLSLFQRARNSKGIHRYDLKMKGFLDYYHNHNNSLPYVRTAYCHNNKDKSRVLTIKHSINCMTIIYLDSKIKIQPFNLSYDYE